MDFKFCKVTVFNKMDLQFLKKVDLLNLRIKIMNYLKKSLLLLTLLLFLLASCSKSEIEKEKNQRSGQNQGHENKPQRVDILIDTVTTKEEMAEDCGFSGVYPKISGLEDKDFESRLNNIFASNSDDYSKKAKVIEGGNVRAFISFEVLTINDTLLSIAQHTSWVVCDANGYWFGAYVVNADLKNNRILTNNDFKIKDLNVNEYNKTVLNYFKNYGLFYGESSSNPLDYHIREDYFGGLPVAYNSEELNKYNFAVENGNLILVEWAMPSARATMGVYKIPVKRLYSMNQNSGDFSIATEQVRKWIDALGKQDFKAAFDQMSPLIRKDYSLFSSTKRYGGITKTVVHSVETESSNRNCEYSVIASYDSYDPKNRDGRFTERFILNNCEGTWEITSIKNISVEYYR